MTSVLLLRGINVGGSHRLPMAELKAALVAAGADKPETYIQSGNAVFSGEVSGDDIAREIKARAGFSPFQVMLGGQVYLELMAANPFPEAVDDHKALHMYFLAGPSAISEADVNAAATNGERVVLTDRVMYLHAPNYLAKSKLVDKLDRLLGQATTGRNWRTVSKIADMVEARA